MLIVAFGIRIPGAYSKGILALSVVSSAYIAEVIRSGIQAIPIGQGEAAEALGMGKVATYSNIILPQAFRIMIPPFTNELVLLLKDKRKRSKDTKIRKYRNIKKWNFQTCQKPRVMKLWVPPKWVK